MVGVLVFSSLVLFAQKGVKEKEVHVGDLDGVEVDWSEEMLELEAAFPIVAERCLHDVTCVVVAFLIVET